MAVGVGERVCRGLCLSLNAKEWKNWRVIEVEIGIPGELERLQPAGGCPGPPGLMPADSAQHPLPPVEVLGALQARTIGSSGAQV